MLRETFRWRKSFDCGFRNNGDLCPDMAPFGQIIGLRQVISEELQNKYDDQLSGKSVFEEFLFHIGFLLLLIGQHQCHMVHVELKISRPSKVRT